MKRTQQETDWGGELAEHVRPKCHTSHVNWLLSYCFENDKLYVVFAGLQRMIIITADWFFTCSFNQQVILFVLEKSWSQFPTGDISNNEIMTIKRSWKQEMISRFYLKSITFLLIDKWVYCFSCHTTSSRLYPADRLDRFHMMSILLLANINHMSSSTRGLSLSLCNWTHMPVISYQETQSQVLV